MTLFIVSNKSSFFFFLQPDAKSTTTLNTIRNRADILHTCCVVLDTHIFNTALWENKLRIEHCTNPVHIPIKLARRKTILADPSGSQGACIYFCTISGLQLPDRICQIFLDINYHTDEVEVSKSVSVNYYSLGVTSLSRQGVVLWGLVCSKTHTFNNNKMYL